MSCGIFVGVTAHAPRKRRSRASDKAAGYGREPTSAGVWGRSPHHKTAERRSEALARALALSRRIARLEAEKLDTPEEMTDRADELSDAADQLVAVFTEYPDVFPDPPIAPEQLRRHVAELREANARVRKEEAEAADLARRKADAERKLDAMLNELGSTKKPDEPS